ncbi:MAG: chemotaxis protein CheD [Bacillota bacterium]|nr:chemotaxis protein CheD [Bacillota bacterium]
MNGDIVNKIVGLGEYAISNDIEDVIKTFALASCVGITVYSQDKKIAGMAHIALPNPGLKYDININKPCYYATLAVPFFFDLICNKYGCNKSSLQVRLFGGADSSDVNDVFEIGKKNLSAVKDELSKINVKYEALEVSGRLSRTLEMDVLTGNVKLTTQLIKI